MTWNLLLELSAPDECNSSAENHLHEFYQWDFTIGSKTVRASPLVQKKKNNTKLFSFLNIAFLYSFGGKKYIITKFSHLSKNLVWSKCLMKNSSISEFYTNYVQIPNVPGMSQSLSITCKVFLFFFCFCHRFLNSATQAHDAHTDMVKIRLKNAGTRLISL